MDVAPLSFSRLKEAKLDEMESDERLMEAIQLTKEQPKVCTTLPERLQCFRGWLSMGR